MIKSSLISKDASTKNYICCAASRLFQSFGIVLCFVLFTSHSSSAQNIQFATSAKSAPEILTQLEEQFQVQFNFNHQHLPEGNFTLSASGDIDHIIRTTCSAFDRHFTLIDKGIYAIQPNPISQELKLAPVELIGWIKDAYNEAIPGATIWIPELNKATQSGQMGKFDLKGYFDPQSKMEIRFLGYDPIQISIQQFLSIPDRTIILETKSHILSDIEVIEYLSWREPSSGNEDVLDIKKMAPMAGRIDKDAFNMVQLLPGISSATEDVSEIQIRGGLPDQTNFEWNDIRIFQTSHFYGKISSVNPFLVDQIRVNRNGGSAKDHGQASGSISLSDNDLVDSLQVQSHVNLLYTNLAAKIPLFKQKVTANVAWRKSYFDFYQSNVYDRFFDQSFQTGKISNELFYQEYYGLDEWITLNSSIQFQDISGSITIRPTAKDEIRFSLLNVDNDLTFSKTGEPFPTPPVDSFLVQNKGYSINYNRKWTDQFQSNWTWSKSSLDKKYQYIENINDIDSTQEEIQINDVEIEAFRWDNSYKRKKAEFNIGYQFEQSDFMSTHSSRDGNLYYEYYNDEGAGHEHSFYAQVLLKPSSRWQLESGLRWSKFNRSPRHLKEPRFHLSFIPFENWTLHAHYGHYHQVLNQVSVFTSFNVEGRYWYLASEEDEWYNETPIAQNKQWSIGTRYRKNNWSVNLDVYQKKITNIHTLAFDFTFEENPYQLAEMDVRGLETGLQYDNKWYSMLWTYEFIKDEFYILSDQIRRPSPYTQPHKLSLFQAFKWKQFECSFLWRFASGRPYSAPRGLTVYVDEFGQDRYELVYKELLTETENNYHTLDITLQYKIGKPQKSKVHGKVGLSFINVYNRKNIIKNYFYVDYRLEPFQQAQFARAGLPFTPNISVDLYFGR